jgi:hypothetical protein
LLKTHCFLIAAQASSKLLARGENRLQGRC